MDRLLALVQRLAHARRADDTLVTQLDACAPEDVAATQKKNLENYFYADVQVFGKYPRMILRDLEKRGLTPVMEPGDLELIRENTVDFVSFSYYNSTTESVDPNAERTPGNTILGVKNPYLPSSEWGWQIDPVFLSLFVDLQRRLQRLAHLVAQRLRLEHLDMPGVLHGEQLHAERRNT